MRGSEIQRLKAQIKPSDYEGLWETRQHLYATYWYLIGLKETSDTLYSGCGFWGLSVEQELAFSKRIW